MSAAKGRTTRTEPNYKVIELAMGACQLSWSVNSHSSNAGHDSSRWTFFSEVARLGQRPGVLAAQLTDALVAAISKGIV
jgi:hypothetical protein